MYRHSMTGHQISFELLPYDVTRLVIEFLHIREVTRLDSATGCAARSPVRNLVLKVNTEQPRAAITQSLFRWFLSRGNIIERLVLTKLNCQSIIDQDLTLLCAELAVIYKFQLSQTQWIQLWSKIHRVDRISLQLQSNLNIYDSIFAAPNVHNRVHSVTISPCTVAPSSLREILSRSKDTLHSLTIFQGDTPQSEWSTYRSANDLRHTDEEWPMLKNLLLKCDGQHGAAVLMMCAHNAVSLTMLRLNSSIIQDVECAVALLQHQIWRPRKHVLRITIWMTDTSIKSNRSFLLGVSPDWITDDPPITEWNVHDIRQTASPDSFHHFTEFVSHLPHQHQRLVGAILKPEPAGFLFFSHAVCFQSLGFIIAKFAESTAAQSWAPLWRSPFLSDLRIEFDKYNPVEWKLILASILDMASRKRPPPLSVAHFWFPRRAGPSVGRQDMSTLLSTLSTSFASTLFDVTLDDVVVNSTDLIAFLLRCRLLKTIILCDIDVFDALPTATTLINSNAITQQPHPKTRKVSIGVRMPFDSTNHDHVWSTIRCIANILNQHCSSYRDPTPKYMTVYVKSNCFISIPYIIGAGSQALADMPFPPIQK